MRNSSNKQTNNLPKPRFDSNSIATSIGSYMRRRGRAVTLDAIIKHESRNRDYMNKYTAKATIGRVVTQLAEYGYLDADENLNGETMYEASESLLQR